MPLGFVSHFTRCARAAIALFVAALCAVACIPAPSFASSTTASPASSGSLPSFTLYCKVDGYGSRLAKAYSPSDMEALASYDTVAYTSYNPVESKGPYARVTTEYVPVAELLNDAGLEFSAGDAFLFGTSSYDYATYEAQERYSFPDWADGGSEAGAKEVPFALAMRSYAGYVKADGYVSGADALCAWAEKADYARAYCACFGQMSPTDDTTSQLTYGKQTATLSISATSGAKELIRDLLDETVSAAVAAKQGVVAADSEAAAGAGNVYVPLSTMASLESALSNAQSARADAGLTNGAAMSNVTSLEAAVKVFNSQKKTARQDPTGPVTPVDPAPPVGPATPTDPSAPSEPDNPDNPDNPDEPSTPGNPGATPEITFPDVDENAWYADAVRAVVSKGLMRGYDSTGLFGVGNNLTRAEFVTILWRNDDAQASSAYNAAATPNKTGLIDVEARTWYTGAANWAVGDGVVGGKVQPDGSRLFAPDDAITFEELVRMIANYAASPADTAQADASVLSRFEDGAKVDAWAASAMAWAIGKGFVSGYVSEDGSATLEPYETVSRERAATLLAKAFDKGVLS